MRLTKLVITPGFEAQLLASPQVGAWLTGLGRLAVPEVRRRAPKRLGFLERGVDFEVIRRAGGELALRIFNSDFKAGWYEFGTSRQAARPSLRPGVAAAIPGARWDAK